MTRIVKMEKVSFGNGTAILKREGETADVAQKTTRDQPVTPTKLA